MLFNSMTFLWIFLPALVALYFFADKKWRNYILLVFSLVFYAWGEPIYILLMIVSIVMNYFIGLRIARSKKKMKKKLWLIIDIVINLGLLGYFKYFVFIIDLINGVFGSGLETPEIVLPIGISFYTFQIMSYVIDLYRGEINVQKNILKLALYISFFPQLIAGPIVKYHDIEKELENRQETVEKFAYGIKRFTMGLCKKVIIADTMALVADAVFDGAMDGLTQSIAWLGAICYMLQIFFDFSGYSDMAIGLGAMFGFKFPENFNLPYISGSVTEFWRRWHISLSTWFKEYLYIPLGGNRKGEMRTYVNLWIVFLATGIWHGAAWSFVVWGIYQGFFIFIERVGFKKILDKCKVLNHIYLLIVALFGWVIFRVPSLKNGLRFIKIMIVGQSVANSELQLYNVVNNRVWVMLVVGILFSGVVQVVFQRIVGSNEKVKKRVDKIWSISQPVLVLTGLIICLFMIINNTYSSFIYFRF